MRIVKSDKIDLAKISLGEIHVAAHPVPYQSVPIIYGDEKTKGNFIIKTPLLSSHGILRNRDSKTQQTESYTLPLNITEEEKFTDVLLSITEKIIKLLEEKRGELRKNKKKRVTIEDLDIVKYKEDGSRFVYPKLYTDKDKKNVTTSFQIRNKEEGKLETFDPFDACKRCEIKCFVGLRIDSVFFSEVCQVIRLKATNVIVKKIKELEIFESIYDEDIGLFDDSSDDEEKE